MAKKSAKTTKPATSRKRESIDLASGATPAAMRAALAKLGKTALQRKYREVFGIDAKSDNVHHLRQALAKKLLPSGPKSAPDEKGADKPVVVADRDGRLPAAGTIIQRLYKGVKHKVKVLVDAFEYGGERHRSLSAIAKSITGQQTNGFLWFGLSTKRAKPASEPAAVTKRGAKQGAAKKTASKKATR